MRQLKIEDEQEKGRAGPGQATLVATRDRTPFQVVADARKAIDAEESLFNESLVGVSSRFVQLRARLRLDQMAVDERVFLCRHGIDVKTVQRDRGLFDSIHLSQSIR